MSEPVRNVVRHGDTTTAGGTVIAPVNSNTVFGKQVALEGSHVSGNNRIVSSPDNGVRVGLEDGQWIEGLFDPSYACQAREESRG